MSLTSASAYNSLYFVQQRLNPGFSPTIQGPDTDQYNTNFIIETTGVNTVYAEEGTLNPLGSTTLDLQGIVDSFNDPISFTRVYSLQVSTTDADLQFGPSAVNPVLWFFNTATDRIVVKAGSSFLYNSDYPFEVDGSNKQLDLYNTSATTALTYRLVIIGGQGAGPTTSTSSTSATTVSSSTTVAPTSTSSTTTAL